MEFSEKIKDFYKIFFPVFLTQISVPGFNQSTKSTDLVDLGEVGRPGRSTDVHKTVHVWQNWDGRPSGSTGSESSALCLFGSTGPVDGHISDRWRSTGPVDRQPVRLPAQPNG